MHILSYGLRGGNSAEEIKKWQKSGKNQVIIETLNERKEIIAKELNTWYPKCITKGQLYHQSDGQFGQFGRPGKCFRHFRGSGCQYSKR